MRVLSFLYTGDYDDTTDIILEEDAISVECPLSPEGSIGTNGMSTATESSSGKADVPRNNLSVYLAANRFHIVLLKQLAEEKYVTWMKRNMTNKRLPDILREAIDASLGSGDHDLHETIAEFIADNAVVLMKNEKVSAILEDFKTCCVGFSVLKRLVKIQDTYQTKIEDLQDEIARRDALWDELASRSAGIPYCRNCNIPFHSRLDGDTVFESAVVCKLCNTVN